MTQAVDANQAKKITLTENAVKRIAALALEEAQEGKMLRIAVSGGGCQGFSYGFSFDSSVNADDRLFEHDGAALVVDAVSLDLLAGSQVDFVEDMMGAYFKITNPKAESTCGCGTSFSVA